MLNCQCSYSLSCNKRLTNQNILKNIDCWVIEITTGVTMDGSEIRENTIVDGFQRRSLVPPGDTSRKRSLNFCTNDGRSIKNGKKYD